MRYTWSRFTAYPVEHIADSTEFGQPICGARLAVERQTFGSAPSGLAPVCHRCQRKHTRTTTESEPTP